MKTPHIDFANYQKLLTKNYYVVRNYRTDAWVSLKYFADLLAKNENDPAFAAEIKKHINHVMEILQTVECYWAFPGMPFLKSLKKLYAEEDYKIFAGKVAEMHRLMVSEAYRSNPSIVHQFEAGVNAKDYATDPKERRHYFEVLIVDNIPENEETLFADRLKLIMDPDDQFFYKVVFVKTFQDAMIALNFNHYIQSCVIRYGIPGLSNNNLSFIKRFVGRTAKFNFDDKTEGEIGLYLGKAIHEYRPNIDLFYVTDTSLDNLSSSALEIFSRIFYRQEDLQEMHLSIKRGIQERYQTPFFTALVNYSQKPTGVFHAMPVSRGNSVFRSNWIRDMGDFYGRNIFLAETSATTGGLDSLLQPKGPLKEAQKLAAEAFGAQHTFFVTNGTSTANKIVLQALARPDDVILIDRDCHKSHHYGLILSGASPVYLDSYPIEAYSMYGAVPLEEIVKTLEGFKEAGQLHKVKLMILTNCTFDGIVYNVRKVMQRVLAIKPDMVFLWDEAWFGYARFFPTFQKRTAMYVAGKLQELYKSKPYRDRYARFMQEPEKHIEELKYMPDPEKVKIRVYASHSTHKTLTSLRQGSMIHVYDEEFSRKVEDIFHEAYMTHTSTSPNYQILASLDVGRRQTMLEGPELVEKSIETAIMLRVKIYEHPLLSKYFDVLTVLDFIPDKFRVSNLTNFYDCNTLWSSLDTAWENDEFVLDPTKITLFVGKTGIDGDTFKRQYLMDEFNIQVNKTTGNTVLFMTNIGTTRSSSAYLMSVLVKIAQKLEQREMDFSVQERLVHDRKVKNLCVNVPPLPNFSYFHDFFRGKHGTPEGDMRKAYFMAYDEDQCTYLTLPECEEAVAQKKEIVSASFVTPYPPGFPVLVPGQVITADILAFMRALSIDEIHGYRKELGFRVFKESVCGPSEKVSVQKKKKTQPQEPEGEMPAAAQADAGQN